MKRLTPRSSLNVVVAVVGESAWVWRMKPPAAPISPFRQSQRDLITGALKATGKPLVLVLMNGRPLALVKEDQQADAILETWFAGTEGGNAIADVLFGDHNPSGKLPMSFPRSVGQIPVYHSHLNTGRPYNADKPNKYTSRYFDEANGPLYPFGYGLKCYTTFTVLRDVKLSSPDDGARRDRDGQRAGDQHRQTRRCDGDSDVFAGCYRFNESSGKTAERF